MAYLDGSGITTLTQEYDSRYIAEPSADGTTGQVLTTDGAGGRTWQTVSGSGGQTTWYGTSSTAATTAAKVVTCEGFTLSTGAIISVLFFTDSTAAVPTLNVNSTGAKSIYIGAALTSLDANPLRWSANTLLTFQYDGNYYRFLGAQSAGTVAPSRGAATWYGTSSTAAATAKKVVTCANFVMTRGALISVTFSTASTAEKTIYLNVNSTGAKTVYYNNAATSASNALTWTAGETLSFIYSGSYYYLVGRSKQQSSWTDISSDWNSDGADTAIIALTDGKSVAISANDPTGFTQLSYSGSLPIFAAMATYGTAINDLDEIDGLMIPLGGYVVSTRANEPIIEGSIIFPLM